MNGQTVWVKKRIGTKNGIFFNKGIYDWVKVTILGKHTEEYEEYRNTYYLVQDDGGEKFEISKIYE